MTCGPALRVVPLRRLVSQRDWRERVGCCVILERGVSPPVAVRESLGILLDELDLSQGARYGVRGARRKRGLRNLSRLPFDLGNLGAVGERLAVSRNTCPVGFHH